jgi:PEP-CTERM motif
MRAAIRACCAVAFLTCVVSLSDAAASPIVILDDFEDGSTENWFAGGGPMAAFPPVAPTNIATGGPGGAGDNFLRITSGGGSGPGSRLVVMNSTQWAMDYLAAGALQIAMDINNLGATELSLRLLFEDPIPGPPSNIAASLVPIVLPASSGWQHVVFPIGVADLHALQGSVIGALSNATLLRIYHDPGPSVEFPGPAIAAQLGVDNVTAVVDVDVVPEPSLLLLVGLGAAIAVRHRLTPRV